MHGTHKKGRWRLDYLALVTAILTIAGTLVLNYPTISNWVSQYNQSKIITQAAQSAATVEPDPKAQIEQAHAYNGALHSGALVEAHTNIPTGTGSSDNEKLDYASILRASDNGLMGRVRIPSIDVDLPIYHGTSDETLLKGVGHLEGTSLPVGGSSTRSVLTAHRGLAEARLFSDLDKVVEGDTFTIEVFDEVLTYRVHTIQVVEPHENESLRVEEGRDLATLVTCTPLGVNSHRILLTGERVLPTPAVDIAKAGSTPDIPRFPWWAIYIPAIIIAAIIYVWRAGYPPRTKRSGDASSTQ